MALVYQAQYLFNQSVYQRTTCRMNETDGNCGFPTKMAMTDSMIGKPAPKKTRTTSHDFIIDLPHKYDMVVVPRGQRFIRGQRRRIAIARSITRQSMAILLDEATSALDFHSNGFVEDAFERVGDGTTTLSNAHRLSQTIKDGAAIEMVNQGKNVDIGTHEQLLRDPESV